MVPFVSGGQQPLVLALLPLDPREVVGAGEPAVDGPAELRLAPEPRREDEVGDLEAEPRAEVGERPELVQLAEPVLPVSLRGPGRDDEAEALQVAEHARRPARARRRLGDLQPVHEPKINTLVSRFARALAAVAVLEPDDIVGMR